MGCEKKKLGELGFERGDSIGRIWSLRLLAKPMELPTKHNKKYPQSTQWR
jgi:hypothetical protein